MKTMNVSRTILFGVIIFCLVGCVRGLNENVVRFQTLPAFDNYGGIRRVAVVPFGEYFTTGREKAVMGIPARITEDNGKVMCDIFAAELASSAKYKVIGPEKVADFFKKRKEKVWGLLTPAEVRRVGALLKADALVLGQVEDFCTYKWRQHTNSRVALQVRMTDSATAEPIWRGSFRIDEVGPPHEVAGRGARLLLSQLAAKREAGEAVKREPAKIIDR